MNLSHVWIARSKRLSAAQMIFDVRENDLLGLFKSEDDALRDGAMENHKAEGEMSDNWARAARDCT